MDGRNAQLSLHHRGLHRLSNSKLKCLAMIHNDFLIRLDGSSAAKRFFESKPRDVSYFML